MTVSQFFNQLGSVKLTYMQEGIGNLLHIIDCCVDGEPGIHTLKDLT